MSCILKLTDDSVYPLRINLELNLEWTQLNVDQWKIQLLVAHSSNTKVMQKLEKWPKP